MTDSGISQLCKRSGPPLDQASRGMGSPRILAARTSLREAKSERPCRRQVTEAESSRSMVRSPRADWLPCESLRRMTAPRRPRSAWLSGGSTPGTPAKLHSAGQRLSRFFAKLRWRRLRALLRAASSSSARSSSWSGPTRSSRRLRSASPRNSPQAPNSRSAISRPAAPNCFWAPSPSLWAVKSRARCARAELASLRVEVVVGPPAVRAGHAGELLAEQRLGLAAVAIGSDAKDRGAAGERPPERALAAAQAPAGLVDVERRGGADVPEQVLVGFVEGPGHALHDGVDRAGREFGAEELPQKLCGVAPRDAVAHREGGDRRLQARAEGSRRHSGGQLGARLQ